MISVIRFFLPVLVITILNQTAPARTIEFAGLTWTVKAGGPIGPGPNYWTDAPEDVYVDAQGRLHLKIVKKGATWYCSEIYTIQFSHYGEHRFLVEGYVDRMDKNMVLGLFVYAADNAEIDIEYSKWGDGSQTKMGGYTIQPYTTPGNTFKFDGALTREKSTHIFDWQADAVSFLSLNGHHFLDAPTADLIQQWRYTGTDIPEVSRNLRTHINFWMFRGNAPTDLSLTEVIITDVKLPMNTQVQKTEMGDAAAPKTVFLLQNYPNPFNDTTIIRYTIPESTHVQLAIYDSSGRLVSELVNREQPANNYQLSWSATHLSSGLYFCTLVTETVTETRKLLLLR